MTYIPPGSRSEELVITLEPSTVYNLCKTIKQLDTIKQLVMLLKRISEAFVIKDRIHFMIHQLQEVSPNMWVNVISL